MPSWRTALWRPGSDHVTWGPMRGLEKNNMKRGQTEIYILTLRLLDQLGPEGRVGKNIIATWGKNLNNLFMFTKQRWNNSHHSSSNHCQPIFWPFVIWSWDQAGNDGNSREQGEWDQKDQSCECSRENGWQSINNVPLSSLTCESIWHVKGSERHDDKDHPGHKETNWESKPLDRAHLQLYSCVWLIPSDWAEPDHDPGQLGHPSASLLHWRDGEDLLGTQPPHPQARCSLRMWILRGPNVPTCLTDPV